MYTNTELFNQIQSSLIEISLISTFSKKKRNDTIYIITEYFQRNTFE